MKQLITFISFVFLFFISCNETDQTQEGSDFPNRNNDREITTEDRVLQVIEALPEYKDAAFQVSAISNGEKTLSIIIEEPNEFHKEYILTVGYNKETWFEPYHRFYVDPKTYKVSIEDMVECDIVPIEVWRKRDQNR